MTPKLRALCEYALMAAIVAMGVSMLCAIAIAFEFHSARVEFAAANADWRRESFRRIDQLLWKADTALELGAAARLDLGSLLTKLRAQVKQASDTSAVVTKQQTQAATAVVTKAIDTTRQAIQTIAGEPARPADDTPAAADRSPVINVPPPVVLKEPPPEPPKVEIAERPQKRRRWFTYLWHWW